MISKHYAMGLLLVLGACGPKDDKKSAVIVPGGNVPNELNAYVPTRSAGSQAPGQKTWVGQCMAPENGHRYRMVLVGAATGDFNVSGDGSTFDTDKGVYRVEGNRIMFGSGPVEASPFRSMSCGRVAKAFTLNEQTYPEYLECAMLESSDIAFFSDCQQIRFVTDAALPSPEQPDPENPTPGTPGEVTVVIVPPEGSPWLPADEDPNTEHFDGNFEGTCKGEGKQTFLVFDKNGFTAKIEGSSFSDTGKYSFDPASQTLLLLDPDFLGRELGSCKIDDGKVTCRFDGQESKIGFFENCTIAEYDID